MRGDMEAVLLREPREENMKSSEIPVVHCMIVQQLMSLIINTSISGIPILCFVTPPMHNHAMPCQQSAMRTHRCHSHCHGMQVHTMPCHHVPYHRIALLVMRVSLSAVEHGHGPWHGGKGTRAARAHGQRQTQQEQKEQAAPSTAHTHRQQGYRTGGQGDRGLEQRCTGQREGTQKEKATGTHARTCHRPRPSTP